MSSSVVLLVEDDRDMRRVLQVALRGRGYEVVAAANGTQALNSVQEAPPHLMILDLGLPDIDGVDVAANVRKKHELPIIVLSARGEEEQQIKALDAGANDFVTKPFREGELMARVRAALRHAPRAQEQRELEVGDIRMDTVSRQVFVKDEEVALTPIEFKLLQLLLCEGGRVLRHRDLLCQVWGPQCAEEVQYLRVFMRQLRAKIEDDAARPRRLVTVLGVGYRLAHA
jgi:two-component system KDP operon response regulator KdpE